MGKTDLYLKSKEYKQVTEVGRVLRAEKRMPQSLLSRC